MYRLNYYAACGGVVGLGVLLVTLQVLVGQSSSKVGQSPKEALHPRIYEKLATGTDPDDRQNVEKLRTEIRAGLSRIEAEHELLMHQDEQLMNLVLDTRALAIANRENVTNLEKSERLLDPAQAQLIIQQYNDVRDLIKVSLSRIYTAFLSMIGTALLWGAKTFFYDRPRTLERYKREANEREEIKLAVETVRHQTNDMSTRLSAAARKEGKIEGATEERERRRGRGDEKS